MNRMLIRYRTTSDKAAANTTLIRAVFAELEATSPRGLRYMALALDADQFVHFVETADATNLLPQLASFQAFQKGLKARQTEPTIASAATIIGNYRMLAS